MSVTEDRGLRALARTGEAEEIIGADAPSPGPGSPAPGAPSVAPAPSEPPVDPNRAAKLGVYSLLSTVSAAVSGYHGMKRNRGSIGWGIVWFALGGVFPVITPVVAVAQGYSKVRPLSDTELQALRGK